MTISEDDKSKKNIFDRIDELGRNYHQGIPKNMHHSEQCQINHSESKRNGDNQNPSKNRGIKTYKYSNKGKGNLYESVIIGGTPKFIHYDKQSNKICIVPFIEESNRRLDPYHLEEYPYDPYEFESEEELHSYIKRAENTNLDELYSISNQIVGTYNDQESHIIDLVSGDIVWSYFQDLSPTTHYLMIVGENDTGKSSLGITFQLIGYRTVKGTGISAANYYRTLGSIEPGQCTIIEDEGDLIDTDRDKMAILKSGYEYNSRVPKTNMNTQDQEQKWYYPYCLKIIIAERSLDPFVAKGLMDRTFLLRCRPSKNLQFKIKDVTTFHNDPNKKAQHDKLMDFRKLMLCYRLVHFDDIVEDIETGLENRNVELCKPLLQLFNGTESINRITKSLEKLVNDKRSRNSGSTEAAVYPIIVDLISKHGTEIEFNEIWSAVINPENGIKGIYDERRPNEYETEEFGILNKPELSKLIADKFGTDKKRKRGSKGSILLFDQDKIARFQKVYDLSDVHIKVTSKDVDSVGSVCKNDCESVFETDNSCRIEDVHTKVYNIEPKFAVNSPKDHLINSNDQKQTSPAHAVNHTQPTDHTLNKDTEKYQEESFKTESEVVIGSQVQIQMQKHKEPKVNLDPKFEHTKCYDPDCDFHTDNQKEYENHGIMKHPGKPLYPGEADLKHLRWSPQGKEWEKRENKREDLEKYLAKRGYEYKE